MRMETIAGLMVAANIFFMLGTAAIPILVFMVSGFEAGVIAGFVILILVEMVTAPS